MDIFLKDLEFAKEKQAELIGDRYICNKLKIIKIPHSDVALKTQFTPCKNNRNHEISKRIRICPRYRVNLDYDGYRLCYDGYHFDYDGYHLGYDEVNMKS